MRRTPSSRPRVASYRDSDDWETVELEDGASRFCEGKVGEVRVAVLYEKPTSLVACDYVWRRTDRWINFPWSDKAPVATRVGAARDA